MIGRNCARGGRDEDDSASGREVSPASLVDAWTYVAVVLLCPSITRRMDGQNAAMVLALWSYHVED